ncbi:MAG: hypothetical protein ACREDT_02190 [Methylocella sp.]
MKAAGTSATIGNIHDLGDHIVDHAGASGVTHPAAGAMRSRRRRGFFTATLIILGVRYGFRDGRENPRGADGLFQGGAAARPNALAQSSCRLCGSVDLRHIDRLNGERQSLVTRMASAGSRGRLFRKDREACLYVALRSSPCNFASIRMMLRRSHAMAAGVADKLWPIADIAAPINAAGKSD